MAVNNGLITYPVGVGEVCNVLVTNHADVGWVCTRDTLINKFAKYKPVRLQNVIDTTVINGVAQLNNDKTWKSTAKWWRGDDGRCGLSISVYDTEYKLTQGFTNDWAYLPPRGSSVTPNEPYRLIDFNQYNHTARCPFEVYITGDYRDEDGNAGFYITHQGTHNCLFFQYDFPRDPTGVQIEDLKMQDDKGVFHNYDDMYVGILMTFGLCTPNNEVTGFIKINPKPIGTSISRDEQWGNGYNRTIYVNEIELYPNGGGANGTWYLYPFVTPNGVRDEGGVDVPFNPWTGPISKNTTAPTAFGLTSISLPISNPNAPAVCVCLVGGVNIYTVLTITSLTWAVGSFKFKFNMVATNTGTIRGGYYGTYDIYVLDSDDHIYDDTSGNPNPEDYYEGNKILGHITPTNVYIDLNPNETQTYTHLTFGGSSADGVTVSTPYAPNVDTNIKNLLIKIVSGDYRVNAYTTWHYRD